MHVVGERLREAMNDRGVDQRKLAEAIGVTQGTISLILREKTRQSKYLIDISYALGVSYDWLTGRSDDKAPGHQSVEARVSRDDLALLTDLGALSRVEQVGIRQMIGRYGELLRASRIEPTLPTTESLAVILEGILPAIDRTAPLTEQSRVLASRLSSACQKSDVASAKDYG